MIDYETGSLGVSHVFRIKGSVFPKAFGVGIPNAILAIVLHSFLRPGLDDDGAGILGIGGLNVLWSGYTFVLGFLIVFRNNQAYSRFWDGANSIAEIRGTWFNAVSSLISFCSLEESRFQKVEEFQYLLLRLVSMLFCSALQKICSLDDDALETLSVEGIDVASLEHLLSNSTHKCEILMQWVQQLTVNHHRDGLIDVPPPILSRAFQELANGIIKLNHVQNIKEVPFPFPYAQMITVMLIFHWIVTPIVASQYIQSPWAAGAICFAVVAAFWSLLYIALELDMPFGSDANDLPVARLMKDFNESLMILMQPLTQGHPHYTHRRGPLKTTVYSKALFSSQDSALDMEDNENYVSGQQILNELSTFRETLHSPELPEVGSDACDGEEELPHHIQLMKKRVTRRSQQTTEPDAENVEAGKMPSTASRTSFAAISLMPARDELCDKANVLGGPRRVSRGQSPGIVESSNGSGTGGNQLEPVLNASPPDGSRHLDHQHDIPPEGLGTGSRSTGYSSDGAHNSARVVRVSHKSEATVRC